MVNIWLIWQVGYNLVSIYTIVLQRTRIEIWYVFIHSDEKLTHHPIMAAKNDQWISMNSIEGTIQQQLAWCDDDPMVVGYFLCFKSGTCFITVQKKSPCFHGSIFLLSSVSHGRQGIHRIRGNQIFHDLRQIATNIAIQLHHITSIAFHFPRPKKITSAGNPPKFLSGG